MSDALTRLTAALADRYRIERELGQGGMATVYLAHDLRHDRRVALKLLRPELAAIIGAERFLQEIRTTANLQHPHILSLFDSGTVDGTVFYVMPYVDGESLRDKLAREKQLPVNDALRIAREVADALQYAHDHGGEFRAQHLDGDLPVVLDVLGEVHRGHPAGTQLALDAVVVSQSGGEAGRGIGHAQLAAGTNASVNRIAVAAIASNRGVPRNGARNGQ